MGGNLLQFLNVPGSVMNVNVAVAGLLGVMSIILGFRVTIWDWQQGRYNASVYQGADVIWVMGNVIWAVLDMLSADAIWKVVLPTFLVSLVILIPSMFIHNREK